MPNPYKLVGMGVPPSVTGLADQATWLRKARPVGLARLVLLRRPKSTTDKLGIDDVLYVSRLLRMYGNGEKQNYGYARYIWSLRNVPFYQDVQAYWVLFIPRDYLADAMWALGVRGKSLDQLNTDAQVIKLLRAKKAGTADASSGAATLTPQQDYMAAVAVSDTSDGRSDYVWRMRAVDAASGDMGEGSLPPVVKDLVVSMTAGTTSGAKPVAWNKEYFNPKLTNPTTGEAVFTLPDCFQDKAASPTPDASATTGAQASNDPNAGSADPTAPPEALADLDPLDIDPDASSGQSGDPAGPSGGDPAAPNAPPQQAVA
jgi:hypothetical protein